MHCVSTPVALKLFEWKGLSITGEHVSGKETADNKEALEASLALRDIILLKAKPIRSKQILQSKEVDFLLLQFATLLGANLPLSEVFKLLRHRTSRKLQGILLQIWDKVETGESLAQSLKPYLGTRDQFIAHMIQVGENSGQIVPLLETLSDYRKRQQRIASKVKKSLIYPVTVLCTALGVSVLLLTSVVPQFAAMYQGSENLPLYTQATIQTSNFISENGIFLFSSISLAIGVMILSYRHVRRVHYMASWLVLTLPLFGKLKKAHLQYLFATLVRVAYQAGTPVDQALTWLPQTTSNLVFVEKIDQIRKHLVQGISLYDAIRKTAVFGTFFEQMISTGESSGKFENTLQQIAEYYNKQIENYADRLTQMVEPALVLITASIIGWIVASMYLPIFNLGTVL